MTTVDRDPEFRSRLISHYQADNLGRADYIITMFSRAREQYITSFDACRALLFGLELWAAHHGYPHPAIAHVEQLQHRYWRTASSTEQALEAVSWLAQSPFSADFADDLDPLRSRLLAIVQRLAELRHTPTQAAST